MVPTFFSSPEDFRRWLQKHHGLEKELWVGFYKKHTGKPSITWPESVDQALCFGWIDGIRKSIDEDRYMIRFTPRKPSSTWSAVNIAKIEQLMKAGLMMPAGIAAWEKRKDEKSRTYSYEQKTAELSDEFKNFFRKNKKAWEFFSKLPPSIKQPSTWWVISAKQEATRMKRLQTLIECSGQHLRIPPLRIDKKK